MQDTYVIGCGLFVAMLITRKDAPLGLAAKLRKTGYTALNCTLCCFGWTVILLFSIGQISALASSLLHLASPALAVFWQLVRLGALVGYGWVIIALIGLASWDN